VTAERGHIHVVAERSSAEHKIAVKGRPGRRHDIGGTVADNTYNGYCVKCKEKRDFQGTVEVSKTGMNMAKGKCPVCGTTVNRILGKAKA
jgi:hypothetical protein